MYLRDILQCILKNINETLKHQFIILNIIVLINTCNGDGRHWQIFEWHWHNRPGDGTKEIQNRKKEKKVQSIFNIISV